MNNKSVVLAFSGGMDSTVILYKAAYNFDTIYTVSFDYNQRHKKELENISYHIEYLKSKYKTKTILNQVLNVPFFDQFKGSSLTDKNTNVSLTKDMLGEAQSKNYVYNRNCIFLSILTGYAESLNCKTVWYGAAQADSLAGYYDGSKEFLQKINELNSLNRKHRILIEAPLINSSKKDIIMEGISFDINWNKTFTCYQGKELSCGVCPACSLRLKGWISAKLKDPLVYENQTQLEDVYLKNNCKDYGVLPG